MSDLQKNIRKFTLRDGVYFDRGYIILSFQHKPFTEHSYSQSKRLIGSRSVKNNFEEWK